MSIDSNFINAKTCNNAIVLPQKSSKYGFSLFSKFTFCDGFQFK